MIGCSGEARVGRVVKTAWKGRMHLHPRQANEMDSERIVRPRTLICCSLVLLSGPGKSLACSQQPLFSFTGVSALSHNPPRTLL
jgi:hypothetical protein